MHHGNGNLDKAIELLEDREKKDFDFYVRNETSFHRGCMFISKSKSQIDKFYKSLFPWLERCEKIFGFEDVEYSKIRMYAYLAERYMSYWFLKYSKPIIWPIISLKIPRKS